MEQFSATILSRNKKGKKIFFSSVMIVAATAIALMVLGIIPVLGQLVWIGVFTYSALQYFLQTRKQVFKKHAGRLDINPGSITLKGKHLELKNISKIIISVYGWKSYSRSEDRYFPLTAMHAGDKNKISFITPGGRLTCEFLLESEEQYQLLRQYVLHWYRKGITVKETVQGMKSYGLQVLMYAQVQEFKKLLQNNNTALQ